MPLGKELFELGFNADRLREFGRSVSVGDDRAVWKLYAANGRHGKPPASAASVAAAHERRVAERMAKQARKDGVNASKLARAAMENQTRSVEGSV
jgi:uncharacterized heparinase superfamily protein